MTLERVRERLRRYPGVAVACSGGCDSLLLADLAREAMPERVRILHVNHHLRPGATSDEALVRRWAAQHSLPLLVLHLDPAALRGHPDGLEAAARAARYAALLAATPQGWALATGHHANDRLETLLLRLQQGAGLSGLAGPRPAIRLGGRRVIRPMLHLWRSELEAEAGRRHLAFATDPTNLSQEHERNRLRHAVIAPWLQEATAAPLARSLSLVAGERRLLRLLLRERIESNLRQTATGWQFPRALLAESSPLLACSMLRAALRQTAPGRPSAAFLSAVVDRAARPGPFELHGEGLTLRAKRDWIEWSARIQSD